MIYDCRGNFNNAKPFKKGGNGSLIKGECTARGGGGGGGNRGGGGRGGGGRGGGGGNSGAYQNMAVYNKCIANCKKVFKAQRPSQQAVNGTFDDQLVSYVNCL